MGKTSYVYLIRRVPYDGFVKVGVTTTPRQRLAAAQCWSPWDIIMDTYVGDLALERQLQRRLATRHVRGEWFRVTPGQLEQIQEWLASSPLK